VNLEREALDAWDPKAIAGLHQEALRLQMMARDAEGNLHRARVLALHATALARTPEEEYRAAGTLVPIEHELGRRDEELRYARALVALRPGRQEAWTILRTAAKFNGADALARQATAALRRLEAQRPPRVIRYPPSAAGDGGTTETGGRAAAGDKAVPVAATQIRSGAAPAGSSHLTGHRRGVAARG
jgi:hypothetical protein